MRAGHHDVGVVATAGFRDHVLGFRIGCRVGDHVDDSARCTGEGDALGVGNAEHRNGEIARSAEGAEQQVVPPGLALVEDDRPYRAGGLGVRRFHGEITRAALHQCDIARREAGKVGRLAAAVRGAVGRSGGMGITRSTPCSAPVTSPVGEKSIVSKSVPSTYVVGVGLICSNWEGAF